MEQSSIARKTLTYRTVNSVVAEDISVWIVEPWHSVNCINCAIEKYSYLLK